MILVLVPRRYAVVNWTSRTTTITTTAPAKIIRSSICPYLP